MDKNNIIKVILWLSAIQKNLLLFRVKVIKNYTCNTGV